MSTLLTEEQKRSYPEFEGKSVTYIYSDFDHGKPIHLIVGGCDYNIGFSLVNPNNSADIYACMHGLASPVYKNRSFMFDETVWNERFAFILNAIKIGVFNGDLYMELPSNKGKNIADRYIVNCPFSM